MSTYLIYHDARHSPADGSARRERIANRVAKLWESQLAIGGMWIVHANATSDEIRDQLVDLVPPGDALIVVGAGTDSAWAGFAPAETDWLVDHI